MRLNNLYFYLDLLYNNMSDMFKYAKIYKMECNQTGKVYIGSTRSRLLCLRKAQHKYQAKHLPKKNVTSAKVMEANDFKMEMIEDCSYVNSMAELYQRERYYIENTPNCVNMTIPGRTKKEYCKYYDQLRVMCECGQLVSKKNRNRHNNTKKHIELVKQQKEKKASNNIEHVEKDKGVIESVVSQN